MLTVLSVSIVACLLIPGAVPARLFALLGIALPIGLVLLSLSRPVRRNGAGGRGPGVALLLLFLLLEGAAAGVLWLSGRTEPVGTGWGGLPPATVVQVVGLWLLPLPLVALAYALTFDRSGITRDDLEALRRRVDGAGPEFDSASEADPDSDPDSERGPSR